MVERLGLMAAVVMPLWNIPLILRIQRRRSSADIGLAWALGVWACILLMLPAALRSPDLVFKVFTLLNAGLFTLVVVQVVRFHPRSHRPSANAGGSPSRPA
jgi:hypothetical protein